MKTKHRLFDLPLGVRFRYPGKSEVYVLLDYGDAGRVARWCGLGQTWRCEVFSAAESRGVFENLEVELAEPNPSDLATSTDDESVLAKLADDPDWFVRYTVACRTTCEATLAKLANDREEWSIRLTAAERTTDETLLAKLAADPDADVRVAAEKRRLKQ